MFNMTANAINTINTLASLNRDQLVQLVSEHTIPAHPVCQQYPKVVGLIDPVEISIINFALEDKKIWDDQGQLAGIQPTITVKVQYRCDVHDLYKVVQLEFDADSGQKIN